MTNTTIGQATFEPELIPSIAPFIHGPVLEETLAAMLAGAGGSKLSPAVADNVKAQVTDVMGAILGSYDKLIASGEVGPNGSARASKQTLTDVLPTGLLYGRVQSGKTNAMIVL